MPLIDLPLAELERYGGRNPRLADFDACFGEPRGRNGVGVVIDSPHEPVHDQDATKV